MLLLLIIVTLLVVFVVVAARPKQESPAPERPTVSDFRRRAGFAAEPEIAVDLLQRNTFVFVSTSNLERRLDHRLEDADGNEIGSALQYPRPGRWANASGRPSRLSEVHVEIHDGNEARVAEIVRPRGAFAVPLSVLDANRAFVGTIAWQGLRRFALRDPLGRQLGTIRRRTRGYRVDYTIDDASGARVGGISDLSHIAERLQRAGTDEGGRKPTRRWLQPDEHVLEITAPVSRDLRLLMLGSAAGLYLTLQWPETDNS